jgi:tRNA modification GTPase
MWMVRNKVDLDQGESVPSDADRPLADRPKADYAISASRGDGVQDLVSGLVRFARAFFGAGEGGLITRERQRNLLQQTADALARSLLVADASEELAAEELRVAAQALGRLLGRVDVEDILDVIFREFCIGK